MATESLRFRIGPALYGSASAAIDGITSATIDIAPDLVRNGMLRIPSAPRTAAGEPRFHLCLPVAALQDVAARLLVGYEYAFYGYEAPYRAFLARHLQPGDLFLDVGAHWGSYALDAASIPHADIAVIACEPVPANCRLLEHAIKANGLSDRIEVVRAAVADVEGVRDMLPGNSMCWRLASPTDTSQQAGPRYPAAVTTIDALLRARPQFRQRRVFLKIDVEGAESAVIAGARAALDSGTIAAIVFEQHALHAEHAGFAALLADLRARGFRLVRFPHHHLGGALMDFVPDGSTCNVIAIGSNLSADAAYPTGYHGPAPLPPPYYYDFDRASRRRRAAKFAAGPATDGPRWADPRNIPVGAGHRARLVAPLIAAGAAVLDLGAGTQELSGVLPAGCHYQPVDLIARHTSTVLADLNRAPPAILRADHIAASAIIEQLHDPAAMLRWCASVAPRLTCVYGLPGADGEPRCNDLDAQSLTALLSASGWRVRRLDRSDAELLCDCEVLQ